MTTREDTEDHLHTMRAARDMAEMVCATSKHTQQDWDDLIHFRAEVHRLEAELTGGDGISPVPPLAAALPVVNKLVPIRSARGQRGK